jgi:hypothetical protein
MTAETDTITQELRAIRKDRKRYTNVDHVQYSEEVLDAVIYLKRLIDGKIDKIEPRHADGSTDGITAKPRARR